MNASSNGDKGHLLPGQEMHNDYEYDEELDEDGEVVQGGVKRRIRYVRACTRAYICVYLRACTCVCTQTVL